MKIPKKFQNHYTKATHAGITYHVGDEVRSYSAKGTILKLAASGAFVQFRGYEMEVAWDDLKLATRAEQSVAKHSTRKSPDPTRRGALRERSESDCESLLAHERAELIKREETIKTLEHTISHLRQENDALQIECKEDRDSASALSPQGKVVTTTDSQEIEPAFEVAGASPSRILRSLAAKETVILIAPRGLTFDEIDISTNVRVIYPVSRSIKWIANDAWRRGYRDSEYTIYQFVQNEGYSYEYSIDTNQTIEPLTESAKPSTPPIQVKTSDACRVEIANVKGKDTVRVIFEGVPSEATIVSLKKHGFRYYHEKGSGIKYWGAFFTSEKLRFAKELCPDDSSEKPLIAPPEPTRQKTDSHIMVARMPEYEFTEQGKQELVTETKEQHQAQPFEESQDTVPSEADLDAAERSINNIEALLLKALKK